MLRTARSPRRTPGLPGGRAAASAAAAIALVLAVAMLLSARVADAQSPAPPQPSPTPRATPTPTPTPESVADMTDEERQALIDQGQGVGPSDAPDMIGGFLGSGIPSATDLVGDVLDALRDKIVEPLAEWVTRPFINWLIDVPDFAADSPALEDLRGFTSAMSLGLIAAMLSLAALSYWVSGLSLASGDSSAGPLEAIQRAIAAALFVIAWPWIYQAAMGIASAATNAVLDDSRLGAAATALGANLFAAGGTSLVPFGAILTILIAVTFLLVVIGITLMKIGMSVGLAVLFIGMPLAAALWVAPALSWIGQLCARAFTGLVLVPVVWALCIAALSAITADFHFVNVLGDDQPNPSVTDMLAALLVGIVGWFMLIKLGQIILQRSYGGGGASAGSMLLHGAIYALVHGSFAGAAGGAGAGGAAPVVPPPPAAPPPPNPPLPLPAGPAAPLAVGAAGPASPPTMAPAGALPPGPAGLPAAPPGTLAAGSNGGLPSGSPPPGPGSAPPDSATASPGANGAQPTASPTANGGGDGPAGQPPPPGHHAGSAASNGGGAASNGADGGAAYEQSTNPFMGQDISTEQVGDALGTIERNEPGLFDASAGGFDLREYAAQTDQSNYAGRVQTLNSAAARAPDAETRNALHVLGAADADALQIGGASYGVEFVEPPRTEPSR